MKLPTIKEAYDVPYFERGVKEHIVIKFHEHLQYTREVANNLRLSKSKDPYGAGLILGKTQGIFETLIDQASINDVYVEFIELSSAVFNEIRFLMFHYIYH